ncbi:MAG: YfhO family protein [Deltaproteobacteria bacterium]|nr:YfhO family protein [Deltaproteobacteria bacterium]
MAPADDTGGTDARATRAATIGAVAILLLAAAALLQRLYENSQVKGPTSYDIYSYAYPMFLQAAEALRHGGRGLLWNPYQSCGEPYLGIGTTGLLYPPSWLFLVLPPEIALYGLLFCNLAIGALGAYGLGRALGAGPLAALCGGLTFAFSNQGADLITFTPIVSGPYAWMSVAMCCTERLLRGARLATALGLGAALALSLLPGHPQMIVYLYQLIALRVCWELVVARPPHAGRLLALFGVSLGSAPLFAGAHLLPALESMRQSIRSGNLTVAEMTVSGVTLGGFPALFSRRQEINNPIHLLPSLLAVGALLTRGARRPMWFYLLVGLLSLGLALGEHAPFFPLYRQLPAGALFRDPNRFLWITSLCLSALVSIGAEALLRLPTTSSWRRRGLGVALPAAVAALLWSGSTIGFLPGEWGLVVATLAALLLAAGVPRATTLAGAVLVGALALNLTWWRPPTFRHLIDGAQLYARRSVFEQVAARRTPQDRVYLVPRHPDHTMQHKTGALFGVPTVFDYESQTSRRWAEYFTYLRTGRPMTTIKDLIYPIGGYLPPGLNRPLLDLTASRYLLVHPGSDTVAQISGPPMPLIQFGEGARLYENTQAVPRARWVPRAEVVAEPQALLDRLASGTVDPSTTVLLEAPPPSGDLGTSAAAGGAVRFTRDDPEDVELDVSAPAAGFVVLSDQDFPGWRATVNGDAAPILRANHVFRAVPVPAGHSTVAFRFRPRSVLAGFALSAAALIGALLLLWVGRARHW